MILQNIIIIARIETHRQMIILNTPTDKVFMFLSTDLFSSSGCHLVWPVWPGTPPKPWPGVLAAKGPDVALAEGLGLGGLHLKED